MRRFILSSVLIALGATAALAQSPAIAQRKDALKSMGNALRPVGPMLRGEAPFALADVQEALKVITEKAPVAAKLFPPDSKEGGETKALPAIWTDNAKFTALFAKLEADAKAAQTSITDEASFKANMPKVLGNCGACHNDFRAK